jgi:hypothetical protein
MSVTGTRPSTVVEVIRLLDANKAKAAFLAPFITGILAIAAHAVVSGEWNLTETKALIGALIMSVASSYGTWATPAKKAEVTRPVADVSASPRV